MSAAEILVVLFGALLVGFGVVGLKRPARLRWMLDAVGERRIVVVGSVVRAVAGVIFLIAAPASSQPTALRWLGWLFLTAAALLVVLGSSRVWRMAGWWAAKPDGVLRASSAATIAVGAFLIYACI